MNVTFAASRPEASSIIAFPVTKDGTQKIAVAGLDDAALALVSAAAAGQRFKGEEGAEGSLKVNESGRSKQEIFNEILKESGSTLGGDAVTAKGSAKKAPADASASEETPGTQTGDPAGTTEG